LRLWHASTAYFAIPDKQVKQQSLSAFLASPFGVAGSFDWIFAFADLLANLIDDFCGLIYSPSVIAEDDMNFFMVIAAQGINVGEYFRTEITVIVMVQLDSFVAANSTPHWVARRAIGRLEFLPMLSA
jgi:integral membrane sensor domain MASE1